MNHIELSKRDIHNVLHLQRLSPGYGTCARCGLPWSHCEPHSIKVTEHTGIFALCTECWNDCDTDERLTFYKALYYEQKFHYNIEFSVEGVIKSVQRMVSYNHI